MDHQKPNGKQRHFTVDVEYCPQAEVFTASSDDIPGLCLETETMDEIRELVDHYGPYLLRENLSIEFNPHDMEIRMNLPIRRSDGIHRESLPDAVSASL